MGIPHLKKNTAVKFKIQHMPETPGGFWNEVTV
jgi:hypothetical protein